MLVYRSVSLKFSGPRNPKNLSPHAPPWSSCSFFLSRPKLDLEDLTLSTVTHGGEGFDVEPWRSKNPTFQGFAPQKSLNSFWKTRDFYPWILENSLKTELGKTLKKKLGQIREAHSFWWQGFFNTFFSQYINTSSIIGGRKFWIKKKRPEFWGLIVALFSGALNGWMGGAFRVVDK